MPNYVELFSTGSVVELQTRFVAKELAAVSDYTANFGIVLSDRDCKEIAQTRNQLLRDTDRVELGVGIVKRIIMEFCDSGYIDQKNFVDTVEGLLECFYSLKTETEDKADDDTVLEFMVRLFENDAGGDVSKMYFCEAYDQFVAYARNGGFNRKKEEY
jgi:hypothetical protein